MTTTLLRYCSFLLTGMFILFVGCSSGEQTGQPSDFDLKQDDNESSSVADAITNPGGDENADNALRYDGVLDDGTEIASLDLDQLTRLMAQMEMEQRRTETTYDQVRIQLHRDFTASRILEHTQLDNEVRYQAAKTKLDALLRLSTMGREEAASQLRTFASPLTEDLDTRIAEVASVAILVTDVARYVRTGGTEFNLLLENAEKLLNKYPESYEVAREIANMGEGLMQANRREDGLKWLKQVAEKCQKRSTESIVQLGQSITDRIQVAEVDFDVIIREIEANQAGAIARLQDVISQMIGGEPLRQGVAQEIIRALNWLEEKNQIEAVKKLNEMLIESADQIDDTSLRNLLVADCEIRRNRSESKGKSFQFEGTNVKGESVDWSRYNGKTILVSFWSTADHASMQLTRQLAAVCESIDPENLEFIAINVCPDLDPMKTLFADQFPDWEIIVSSQPSRYDVHATIKFAVESNERKSTHNSIADHFGVIDLPYLMVVNSQGQIAKAGVRPTKIKQELRKALRNGE